MTADKPRSPAPRVLPDLRPGYRVEDATEIGARYPATTSRIYRRQPDAYMAFQSSHGATAQQEGSKTMAKSKLSWTTVNVAGSSKGIQSAWDAEQKALAKTDDEIRKAVAKAKGCKPEHVVVGRNWGKLSFAIDETREGTAAPSSGVAL